jgi:hypothetical protein
MSKDAGGDVKFFFPDSQDFVDESFDFDTETRSESRIRQQGDAYPHQVFASPPYDGLLVSKAVVDGRDGGSGKYTFGQRQRLLRLGVREYFRLQDSTLETMGDCGAFSYVREPTPPYTAEEVAYFYNECGFDYGFSVDHVILGYADKYDQQLPGIDFVPQEWRGRQEITLKLAEEFWNCHRNLRYSFTPIGVAQGWSPKSYRYAVEQLQRIGYRYIAFGGFVPLKTRDILATLKEASQARLPETQFHLLGITRCENVEAFQDYGAISFDSTSPLRKAFKDDKHNYYTPTRTYSAVRVPQVDANPKLLRRITAGQVDQQEARALEQGCLRLLKAYDSDAAGLEEVVDALVRYERLHDGQVDRTSRYREVLNDRPWKQCSCEVCVRLGIHVIIFRGAERNRRRGYHNLYVFYRQLSHELRLSSNRGLKGQPQAQTDTIP